MLTESEKEWLADSEKWNFKLDIYGNSCFCPSCKHCEHFTETANGVFCQDAEDMWIYDKLSECPLIPSKELLHDAALFEARVAAKLAERCVLLENVVQKALGAAEYINLSAATENALKAAQFMVEEEMDGR